MSTDPMRTAVIGQETPSLEVEPEASGSISSAFERILRDRRYAYNFRWSEARSRFPHITANDAASFFVNDLAPLINALSTTASVTSERLESICDIAVEVGAKATGLRLLGVNAAQPWVTELWRSTLPALAHHVAANPLAVISELSHATAQFTAHGASRPQQWLRLLRAHGPEATDLDQLRLLGKVLAWRSGLAHYRAGALAAADQLPTALTELALEIPTTKSWALWRGPLQQSCWPDSVTGAEGLLAKVGSFRGLGGVFVEPPMLATRDDDLIARSGNESWVVSADVFGSTLHRNEDAGIAAGVAVALPIQMVGDLVVLGSHAFDLGAAAPVTSAVHQGDVLVLTTKNSYAIWFLATGRATPNQPQTGNQP
jgi:hypothetical protein